MVLPRRPRGLGTEVTTVKSALVALWLLTLPEGDPTAESFAGQMEKIGVRDAIVIASAAIDEHPVWSPDGKSLAANVDEKWVRIEIDGLKLERADWRGGKPVGLVHTRVDSPVDEPTVREWEQRARFDPRQIKTRSGTLIELRQGDLGTTFAIKRSGSKEEALWTTSMENCYGLALSPDDRYVAFVCEQTGVVVATP